MGAFDWLGQVFSAFDNRWKEDWKDFGHTFVESWKNVPTQFNNISKGLAQMSMAPFSDDVEFWGGARLWADSVVGSGSALAGGTVGTVFQAPILHEGAWLLDKAYRYGIARPVATSFLMQTNTNREAYATGKFGFGDFAEQLFNFNNLRRAWNDSEYVTPGQAIIYMGELDARSLMDMEEAHRWANDHDPRTMAGQLKFNSPNAEFFLKYGSGSIDFAGNVFADPGHGASALTKAAKLRLVDKVADAKYIAAGKVAEEVGTNSYLAVHKLARESETAEQFGQVALPTHRNRGQVQTLLWAAAKMDDAGTGIYRDTYLTVRAFDPEAFKRLADNAPAIAESFANQFAKHTINDFDVQRGQLASDNMGADALRQTTVDAFVDSFAAGEGIWGSALGKGALEAMPRVRRVSQLRAGYHSGVLAIRPIIVGRALVNMMPSSGWTPRIDPMDGTGIGLRQFRSNLERTNVLTPDEINQLTSQYGAATSDSVRQTTAMRAEDGIVTKMLDKYGLSREQLRTVLDNLNEWRFGSRKLWGYERVYISERAAERAEKAALYGRDADSVGLYRFSDEYKKVVADGEAVDGYVAMTDVDGNVNLIPAVDRNEPMLRSQFTDAIAMLDYRALNGALRWYDMTHPKSRRMPDPDDAGKWVNVEPTDWRLGLARLAKLRGFYDAGIGALDSLSVMWKATALMRPAQAPRNVSDDVLRTYLEFGRLPLLVAASDGLPNAARNFVGRGKLWIERIKGEQTRQHASGKKPTIDVDVDGDTADNLSMLDPTKPVPGYMSYSGAFADGAISLDQYATLIMAQLYTPLGKGKKFGKPRFEEPKPEAPQMFRPTVTAMVREEELGVKGAKAAASATGKKKPPRQKAPRYSEQWPYTANPAATTGTPYIVPHFGPPHLHESLLVNQHLDGKLSYAELRLNLAYAAITRHGRNKYFDVAWGNDLIRTLVEKHLTRRDLPGYKDDPFGPGTVVIDPFTGLAPEGLTHNLSDNFVISTEGSLPTYTRKGALGARAGTVESVPVTLTTGYMRHWVTNNLDELLKPGTLLAMRVRPDGNIAIGYARAKSEVAKTATVKVGAKERIKDFWVKEIQDMAHTGFEVKLRDGRKISFAGVLEGDVGEQMLHRISSRSNPSVAWGSLASDVDMEMLLQQQGSWAIPLRPSHRDYDTNWERAANAQIASDPVARLFLEGKSDTQVIDAVWTSTWGQKWMRAMGFRGIAYVDQIRQIEAMVDEYIPSRGLPDSKTAQAQALRQAVLDKKATADQFKDLFRDDQGKLDEGRMPEIHGMSVDNITGAGKMWQTFRNIIRKAQTLVSDMPVDKIARFPFMAMAYQKHGTELAKIAGEYFKDGPVPANVVGHIKELARERAYHDTRYRLYDTAQRNDLANATRLFMPFSAAMMDSYIKYGRRIRENPMILVQGAYYWNLFERNNMVQDENGNVAAEENGQTVWYSVDPKTGERTRVADEDVGESKYVQFQLPFGMSETFYGAKGRNVIAVNKKTLNVFLNEPSAGPLVALPASEFALSNPEFGENNWVRRFILPFGPSSDWSKVALPTTVRSAIDAFQASDGDRAAGEAAAIMQAELTGYALKTRNAPPTYEEVRQRAAGLMYLRFAATYFSPASFQVVSPYQMYVDAYRQLMQKDPTTASEEFMRRYGDEYYAMTMSVTRNAAGITASLESHKQYQKFKDLIARYPEFGGLIVGAEGAGDFAKSVYEAQKETPVSEGSQETLRSLMGLTDQVTNLNEKVVWAKYSKMMKLVQASMVDRGITNLNSRAAVSLRAQVDAFIQANRTWIDPESGQEELSPWYKDFMSSDRGQQEYRLSAMQSIVQQPELQGREDIRGLAEYLAKRRDMREVMKRYGFASLESRQARFLQRKWEEQVFALTESNAAFHDLWTRWLSQDTKLDYPKMM
jgi:hypothetical protein